MTSLTTEQIRILRHSLGLTRAREPYRNHYVLGERHTAWGDVQELTRLGLMEEVERSAGERDSFIYQMTEKGKDWLRAAGIL